MAHTARPFVLAEATFRQTQALAPNVAVLPWGATEAHNWHLPHGTDNLEADHLAAAAAERANRAGGRVIVLPCVPFGNNNTQLTQTATITMRSATQQAVLRDVAESLVWQGIDRLVVLNFHGGNEFKPMIRDVMLDLPIFIVQVYGYQLAAPYVAGVLKETRLGHADEFETSLLLHLAPHLVAPLDSAGPGATTPSALPGLTSTPGTWCPRDWASLTADSGDGDPRAGTAEKGAILFERMVASLALMLRELSGAQPGQFPFILRRRPST